MVKMFKGSPDAEDPEGLGLMGYDERSLRRTAEGIE